MIRARCGEALATSILILGTRYLFFHGASFAVAGFFNSIVSSKLLGWFASRFQTVNEVRMLLFFKMLFIVQNA